MLIPGAKVRARNHDSKPRLQSGSSGSARRKTADETYTAVLVEGTAAVHRGEYTRPNADK